MGSQSSKVKQADSAAAGGAEEKKFTVKVTPELLDAIRRGPKNDDSAPNSVEEAYQKGVKDGIAHAEASAAAGKQAIEVEDTHKERVSQLAAHFRGKVFVPTAKPLECEDHMKALLDCYKSEAASQGDVLKCASLVDAYDSCAKQAVQGLVKSQSS
uniref:CHCH domain-containing protein n=1 Tax=Fibrocapsa japonica TaxID=94617 RepID=A0A7S2V2Z7_9STRA|mmetsp:Transcript_4971/g.7538  ORF Transcript_4971/g.7538 Transcript_4971/m.7538 type:complete len:156 (+) Transcript_4971:31-498(+)